MHKHGKTSAGKQRWLCPVCRRSTTRNNPAPEQRRWRKVFEDKYIRRGWAMTDIADYMGASLNKVRRRFEVFFADIPAAAPSETAAGCLSLDGFWLRRGRNADSRNEVVLVSVAGKAVRDFAFADGETRAAWKKFIAPMPPPGAAVTDGNAALLLALGDVWPGVSHQRCLAHVKHEARRGLWSCRSTKAGRGLETLRQSLMKVRTRAQARLWRKRFDAWGERNGGVLAAREVGVDVRGRRVLRRYVHGGLRAAHSHLHNAAEQMFTHLFHEDVPRTTSYVEGGINSVLRESLRRHRGLRRWRQKAVIAHLLHSKRAEKSHTI